MGGETGREIGTLGCPDGVVPDGVVPFVVPFVVPDGVVPDPEPLT